MEEIGKTPGFGARPHGHQAAVYQTPGNGSFLRFRVEGHLCSSGDRPPTEPCGTRLLPFVELCAVPVDAGGRHREASPRAVAGMARWPGFLRHVLEIAVHARGKLHTGIRKGRAGRSSETIRARAHDFRCAAGNLAERWDGFDHYPALR